MKAEVTIYTMNGCPFCTKAKAFFEQKGITPREINIDERRDKTKEVLALNPKGSFPTMIINGRVVVGFVPDLMEDALSRAPPPKREIAVQNLIFDPFEQ